MSSYDRVRSTSMDDTDDGEYSVASSIEAPPFALANGDSQGNLQAVAEYQATQNKPETIVIHQNTGIAGSQAWSSMTTSEEKSMLESSATNSQSIQESRPNLVSLVQSPPPTEHRDEGYETVVFDAADSFLGSPQPMLGQSSHLPGSGTLQGTLWAHDTTPNSHTAGGGSLDFSQLMRQADDRNQSIFAQSRMPTLQEETLVDSGQSPTSTGSSSNVTPRTTNRSGNNWLYTMFFGESPPQTLSSVPMMSLSSPYMDERMEAGRNIQATRLGENVFEVTMQIDPPCTVRDVLDVVGNPDLLRLWCDPIRALVITKSSEGARSATNRREEGGNREYEGEWIEATTSMLVSPSKHSSYLYSLGSMLYTCLGFPSYGKITMFVERLRGQVGLTIGPFSGGVVASHTIKIQDDGPVVSVVDRVRLSRDEEYCMCCCGLCDPVKRCFMPRMAGHMEQVMSSMLRLRVLVEHGEMGSYSVTAMDERLDENQGISSAPLLSSGGVFN